MVYDLIVLGGGPGGYLAAERAGHAGLNVLLIEKNAVGGVCLNEGCIPSKTLLNSAKIFDYTKHSGDYGITVTGSSIDQAAVIKRKRKVVTTLVSGVRATLKANKVTIVDAEGEIAHKEQDGFVLKAGGETYKGAHLIVATGSTPVTPPITGLKEGLESGFVMTNREVLDLEEIPGRMAVIGGGVIGLEMASYYNSVGTKVTVVEMLDHIAGPTDLEVSGILQAQYAKKGIDFRLGCKVVKIGPNAVVYESEGKTVTVECDKILLSIGRRAVTTGFGLENLRVLTERGAIVTDSKMRTNIAGVYAVGDVNGKSMLAHTAYREAEVAVNNILGKKDIMRYGAIPSVIYTNPEVGSVGETEETAKEKGIGYKVGKVSMYYAGRFVAETSGQDGICKVLVNKADNRIIGVHIIGSYASEMIVAAGMLVECEMRLEDAKEIVFPHPTVSEIIREAIFAVK